MSLNGYAFKTIQENVGVTETIYGKVGVSMNLHTEWLH